MPEIWIAITGLIILFLFWRQLIIFRVRQKINYAPIVLIISLVSSISLFVFTTGTNELKHDIQYALMPLLIGLIFYLLMYIMHQFTLTRTTEEKESHERLLATLIADIQGYFGVLDEKLIMLQDAERKTLEAVQLTLKNELADFSRLSQQQALISSKLEQMYIQEEQALMDIRKFLQQDMVDFDKVVHRHIDILRIAEQDHFNKMISILENMNDNRETIETFNSLVNRIQMIEESFEKSASAVIKEVKEQLLISIASMKGELANVKQLSEALNLSTQEYEAKLQELHKQASQLLQKSDIIHESMEDTYTQSQKLSPVYASLNELISRLMDIYAEYKHAKKELQVLSSQLGAVEEHHFEVMDKKIDHLGENIHQKIEASLKELKEHYHLADTEVSNTVKTLAAKAQMQKSYTEE